nr:hypothetical protein [uncultured Tateyamaria sp.]
MPHLFGVFLAVMLGHAGEHVLDQAAVAVVAKLDGGAFQLSADRADSGAQLDMGFEIAGKTRDVVNDDNGAVFAVFAQPCEHLAHGGAVVDAACDAALKEDLCDVIAAIGCKIAASGFLSGKAVPLFELRF